MRRVVVIGPSAAGKTTLALALATRLNAPHIEIDALHWEPNWTPCPTELFRARIAQAVQDERWVADGNYSKARDIVWAHADTIVWLDYGLLLVLWRLLKRTLGRVITGAELWNGNRETWRGAFFGQDSLFLYTLRVYHRQRRQFAALPTQPEYAHLRFVRLRTPAQTAAWLVRVTGALPDRE